MAEFSAPFDDAPIATQSQWSRMARRWGLDGVHASDPADTALKVTGAGTGVVTLQVGEAFVNGFYYLNDAVKSVDVVANAGTVARVDMVVLRASMSAKTVRAIYKTGGTSAPTLAADEGGVYEIPLAQCTVAAGSSVVTAVNVVDRRWFTGRGAITGAPGDGRPAHKGQLRVEGTALYVGNGAAWRWLASAGTESTTYTPQWSAGSTNFHWGTSAVNIGRYQVQGSRVDLTIHVAVTSNPPGYSEAISVTLPPGLPCTSAMNSLFKWTLVSANAEGTIVGLAMTFPTESTTRIARLRYPAQNGSTTDATPRAQNLLTNAPYNIRPGDTLTIDGSYWLA